MRKFIVLAVAMLCLTGLPTAALACGYGAAVVQQQVVVQPFVQAVQVQAFVAQPVVVTQAFVATPIVTAAVVQHQVVKQKVLVRHRRGR